MFETKTLPSRVKRLSISVSVSNKNGVVIQLFPKVFPDNDADLGELEDLQANILFQLQAKGLAQ